MLGKPKRRKIDQFLQEYRKDPEVALSESTRLSNRLWRLLIGLVLTLLFVFLLLPLEPEENWGQLACLSTLVFLINGLGWLVLLNVKPGLFDRPSDFNRFIIVLVATVLLARFTFWLGWPKFLVPVPILAMVLTMCYGQSVALFVSIGVSFYLSLMSPALRGAANADSLRHDVAAWSEEIGVGGLDYFYSALIRTDIVLALSLIVGAMAVIVGIKRVRQQSKPTLVGGFAGMAQAVVVVAFQCVDPSFRFQDLHLENLPEELGKLPLFLKGPAYAFIGGMASGALVTVFLPVIETFFEIITERRLLALGDGNNELLRTLRNRAPGTYQHTFGVAQLSTNAAEAIGADSLLCQVGAYYHDIGKMVKPEYFVENMGEDKSIHTRLRPSMSKLIIISHVKEGVELALEANLPEKIVDMIPMHHGTTVVEYFFHKALEEGNGEARKEKQTDTEYRYPGPRPRFPEAGVLMLADAVEAIAKSMQDPNPSRFRDMVRQTIRKRLLDGQLDECTLTMRDFTLIEESFVRTLTNMYHARIRYPSGTEGDGPEGGVAAGERGKSFTAEGSEAESGTSEEGVGTGVGDVGDREDATKKKEEKGSSILRRDAV